ncbi:hypothetical protein TSAR_012062 [Trichomalopsis sarcophagae]|uniref:Uncharacterized protein n=1 Tax=Trichomalopsis sarcophagae TaxID=543379 RepID=A0A232EL27_9HYME|nr:hypothetical protein TSAR_012062 [Trichomalopsis sarcophagae]
MERAVYLWKYLEEEEPVNIGQDSEVDGFVDDEIVAFEVPADFPCHRYPSSSMYLNGRCVICRQLPTDPAHARMSCSPYGVTFGARDLPLFSADKTKKSGF